jgi:murein DD-endopeptidase MepM/ murein hydrolase activator NlpD
MSKHRKEAGHTPRPALREYFQSSNPSPSRTARGGSKSHARNSVVAAIVATGAFVAVGQPFAANANSSGENREVNPLAAQQNLSAAVNGTDRAPASVALLKADTAHGAKDEARKVDKSKAIEQARARADADRRAAEEQAARKAAEGRAAQKKAAEAERAKAAAAAGAANSAGFVKPTEGTFTSGFGFRSGSSHNGVDLANNIGTPIRAVTGGEVISAGPVSGFGQWVRLQHEDGTITVYGHVNTIDVSVGQKVRAGEQIATMGNRGQSTGPHLHFEVMENGSKINPLSWLQERGIDVR